MSCVLRIIGKDFDPDGFVERSQLQNFKITHKGTPRFRSKPESEKVPHSAASCVVSEASFDEFNKQVEEVIIYLKENYAKLRLIADTPGVEYATLDFGINYQDKFVQSHYLPTELIKLAGELRLSIEMSLYISSDDGDEELEIAEN